MTRLYLALATFAAIGVLAFGFLRHHDRKVEERTVAKIEKTNATVAAKGRRAAVRSADPRVPGTRDPSTRDD